MTWNQTAFSYKAPNLIRVIMHCCVHKTVHPSSISITDYPALMATWDLVHVPAVLVSCPGKGEVNPGQVATSSQVHRERWRIKQTYSARVPRFEDKVEIILIATELIKTKNSSRLTGAWPGILSGIIALTFQPDFSETKIQFCEFLCSGDFSLPESLLLERAEQEVSTSRFCRVNLFTNTYASFLAVILPLFFSSFVSLFKSPANRHLYLLFFVFFCFLLKSCLIWVFVESHVCLNDKH